MNLSALQCGSAASFDFFSMSSAGTQSKRCKQMVNVAIISSPDSIWSSPEIRFLCHFTSNIRSSNFDLDLFSLFKKQEKLKQIFHFRSQVQFQSTMAPPKKLPYYGDIYGRRDPDEEIESLPDQCLDDTSSDEDNVHPATTITKTSFFSPFTRPKTPAQLAKAKRMGESKMCE